MEQLRIGLISDTHVYPGESFALPSDLVRVFDGVDQILHCGDVFALSVLDWLETIAPVRAVRGFGDPRTTDHRVDGPTRVIDAGGLRIGMIHYINWPGESLQKPDGSLEFPAGPIADVLTRKFAAPVDVVVFGDSHQEYITSHEGVLFVNPGSAAYPRVKQPEKGSGTIAILTIAQGQASAGIVWLGK